MYQHRKYIHFIYLFIDILLITISFLIPYILRYNPNLIPRNLPDYKEYFLLFFLWGFLVIYFLSNNLYSTDRSLSIFNEVAGVVKCVLFSSILAGLLIFFLQLKFFSRLVFTFSVSLLIFNLSLFRAVKRLFIRYRILRGYYNINVLIIGAGRAGISLAKEIKNNPYLGLKIVGFLDDDRKGEILDCKILGEIKDLRKVIQEYFIDELYITIPSERKLVSEIIEIGRETKKTVKILAYSFSLPFVNLKLDYIGFLPLLHYFERELHKSEKFAKRFLDIVVSGFLLVILMPLFIVIALLIKMDSRGDVFYISKRCGRKGKLFDFYKFRSMITGADKYKDALRPYSEIKGPAFKIRNDPRITKVGRILRKYSLDELPQLINVFKGDMSLVGPRPLLPDEMSKLETWQLRPFNIKPGITGLWQVRGRSNLSFYKRIRWDMWYIDNWSFSLDLRILFWTISAVLKRKGAY